MTTDEILTAIARVTALEAELNGIRRAPPTLSERLAQAEAEAARAAGAFRDRPFHVDTPITEAGLRFAWLGFATLVAPKIARELIEAQVRSLVKADPREPLDTATRATRSAAVEAEIAALVAELSHDDLAVLRTAAAGAHAAYRGLAERLSQAEERASRRAAEITAVQNQRESIWRPPPLVPLAMVGDFSPPVAPPPRRSAEERAAAREAVEQQLAAEVKELERDQRAVEGLKVETAAASERWRQLAQTANQLERLLLLNRAPPIAA